MDTYDESGTETVVCKKKTRGYTERWGCNENEIESVYRYN